MPAIGLIKQGSFEVRVPLVPEIAVDRGQLQPIMSSAEGRHSLKACLGEEAWQGLRRKEGEGALARKRALEAGQAEEKEQGAGTVSSAADERREGEGESSSSTNQPHTQQQECGLARRAVRKRPAQAMEREGASVMEESVEAALASATREGEGAEGSAVLGDELGPAHRRRLRGKQPPPQVVGQTPEGVKDKITGWSKGHAIHKRGNRVFCVKCGNYALRRFGRGLQGRCSPTKTLPQAEFHGCSRGCTQSEERL